MAFNIKAAKEAGYTDQEIQAYLNKKQPPSGSQDVSPIGSLTNNPFFKFLLGSASNVAQDIGTGTRAIMEKGSLKKNDTMAKTLEDQAYATKNTKEKAFLLKNANNIRQGISAEAGDIAGSFSDEVNQNPLWRGANAGVEVASTAMLPETVWNTGKAIVTKGGEMLGRTVAPRATASLVKSKAAEEATKQGLKFVSDRSMKEASQFILDKKEYIEPATKSILEKIATNQYLTPSEVSKMQPILREFGNTLSNNALRSSEGQAFNYLYDNLLNQSKTIVPKMFKETVNIAKTFPTKTSELEPLQRLIRTQGPNLIKYGGGMYLLNKILGRSRGSNYTGNSE